MACNLSNTYAKLGTIQPSDLPDCCGNWCRTIGTSGCILDAFGSGVTTCAQAIELIALDIGKRLGGVHTQVTGLTPVQWRVTWRLSQNASDVGTAVLTARSNCNFPVDVQWERAARKSQGTVSFQTIDSLVSFLVGQFKK